MRIIFLQRLLALPIIAILGGLLIPPAQAQAPRVSDRRAQPTAPTVAPPARTYAEPHAPSRYTAYLPLVLRALPGADTTVAPGVAGEIIAPDAPIHVRFSSAAVQQPVHVHYQSMATPMVTTPSLAVGGPAFSLHAWTTATQAPITSFPPAVTIISGTNNLPATSIITPSITIAVQYTDRDVWGLDLRTLALYTRHQPSDPWQPLPTAVYQDRKLIIAEVDHLSEFVPMAQLAVDALAATTKRLALDPDDDVGVAVWPGEGIFNEITYNMRLAEQVNNRLQTDGCQVTTLLTRQSVAQRFVSRSGRATMAENFGANMFVTLAFNAFTGKPWGSTFDGGPVGWARPTKQNDNALVSQLYGRMDYYTKRPPRRGVQKTLLYPEFANLSMSSYAHLEALFLDHNADHPVITTQFSLITDAVYAAIRTQLEAEGMQCLVPNPNGTGYSVPPLPPAPDPAVIQRLRDLGYQNYQRYGADPVSFSTGNHIVQTRLFRIPGRGGMDIDVTLTYNAQDGRDSLFGYGWSFPYNARAQHYNDDSVSITLSDGRTYHYTWDGSRYVPPAGVFDQLEQTGNGWRWTTADSEQQLLFQEVIGLQGSGFGILVEQHDRRGNVLHFEYDLRGQDNWKSGKVVPRPSLETIRDGAGRTITVTSNGDGHITGLQMPAPDNRTFTFTYDNGDLKTITDAQTPIHGVRTFEYDERHRLTKEWDAENIPFLENKYDDRDRVIQQWDTDRTESFLSYDPVGGTSIFTDNLGFVTTYTYDSLNRVTGEHDALGGTRSTVYNPDYTVMSSTDERSNTTAYTYDNTGNLLTRSDPLPKHDCSVTMYSTDTTSWRYDTFNRVISTTNALGATWRYEYDSVGNLTRTTEPNGAVTRAQYDPFGQTRIITDALDRVTTYDYDLYGNLARTTNAAGGVITSTYDIVGREQTYADANNHTVGFGYDGNDNITAIRDPRLHATTFTYNRNNLLLSSIDRRGAEHSYRYDQNLKLIGEGDFAGAPETLYTYDKLYRRTATTDPLGFVTHYAYDHLGRVRTTTDAVGAVTHYAYDAAGNLTAVVDPLGARTEMTYDVVNRLSATVDAAGHRTQFCYDAEDRLVRTIGPRDGEVTAYGYDSVNRLVSVTNPLGRSTVYEFDLVGNRTVMTDTLGYRSDYRYDALDRLVTEIRPILPDGTRPTTQYGYDAVGNTTAITTPRGFATHLAYDENDNLTAIVDPLGARTSFTYDEEDNQLTATDANGNITTTTYNPVGLPITVKDGRGATTRMEYDPAYNLVQLVNAEGRPTSYEYDPTHRLIRASDPLGNATRYRRDKLGRVTAMTDANDHVTGYDYDALGRLRSVTDAANGATRYSYDEDGNLVEIADANNHVTRFEYDLLNQMRAERNPIGNTWRYGYDAGNRLAERIDALGRRTSYEYDSNNRLVGVDYGAPQEQAPLHFAYDPDGNQTQMCDGLGCANNAYDPLGRQTSATDWAGRTVRHTYDGAGNLLGMIYPNGRRVQYEYDQANQLVGLTDPRGAASAFKRNPLGQVTDVVKPNGTAASFGYDAASRLISIDQRKLGANTPQSAYAYTLDNVGNRTQVVETRAAFDGSNATITLNHSYGYDALNRLVRSATASPNTDTGYRFDAVGNRTERSGTALAPDAGLPQLPVAPGPAQASATYNDANQLLTMGDSAFGYDADGARTSKTRRLPNGATETTDYRYDREDRLASVTTNVGGKVTLEAEYRYDGYGRRALKIVRRPGKPAETTTFLYDGLDLVGAKLERNGASDESYYYLAPSPITGLRRPFELEKLSSGKRYWFQTDGLDSVAALTDESGDLVSPFLYDDYGKLLTGAVDLQLLTYTAQDYDAETGLLHFYARTYDAETGVWLTQDAYRGRIDAPGTLGRYGYVGGNPLAQPDFLGFAAVFVHGIRDQGDDWVNTNWWSEYNDRYYPTKQKHLNKCSDNLTKIIPTESCVFDYEGNSTIVPSDTASDRLYEQIKYKTDLVLVAHSKGGNVVENLMQRHPDVKNNLKGIVFIEAATGDIQGIGGDTIFSNILAGGDWSWQGFGLKQAEIDSDALGVPIYDIRNPYDPVACPGRCTWIKGKKVKNISTTSGGWKFPSSHGKKSEFAKDAYDYLGIKKTQITVARSQSAFDILLDKLDQLNDGPYRSNADDRKK